MEAVCAPFSFEAAPVLQTGLLLTVLVRSNCGCSVRDVYYPGGLPIRCLSYSPFSFEAAHGVLQCHGELVAVPRAEGCTQWLLLVCRRAAYAGLGSLIRIPSCHQARARLERLRSVQRLCFRHPSSVSLCLSIRL